VIDSGVLGALADNDSLVWEFVSKLAARGHMLHIPSVVLAECLTGTPSDHGYRVVIKQIGEAEPILSPVFPADGELAGKIRYRSGLPHATVDALIVAVAASSPPCLILTGDSDDIEPLASATGKDIRVKLIRDMPRGSR
jgi:hypothetical protein